MGEKSLHPGAWGFQLKRKKWGGESRAPRLPWGRGALPPGFAQVKPPQSIKGGFEIVLRSAFNFLSMPLLLTEI